MVLAPGIDAGFGWLVDPSAVQVVTDGEVRMEWNSATGFSRNTVIARCETRVNLAVKRPAGIARLDLTAAYPTSSQRGFRLPSRAATCDARVVPVLVRASSGTGVAAVPKRCDASVAPDTITA